MIVMLILKFEQKSKNVWLLFCFCFLFCFLFFRSWPWPHCCCNSLHWPNRHRSWKTMRIKWATICSRLWLSWALWCAFSSYCPIACWFTVPNEWVIPPKQTQRLRKCSKLTIMFMLVFCLFVFRLRIAGITAWSVRLAGYQSVHHHLCVPHRCVRVWFTRRSWNLYGIFECLHSRISFIYRWW